MAGRCGAGLAGGGGGAGLELGEIGGGAAAPGGVAGWRGQAEVAADFGDDVGDGAVGKVPVEVGGVEAVVQLGGQCPGGVVGLGVVGVLGGALDRVLDGADDLLAGGGAVDGGVLRGRRGEAAREEDAAADGSGEAVKGGDDLWERRGGRCGVGRGVLWGGRRGGGLLVQGAGEVGADGDEVVQNLAVEAGVLGLLAGVVWVGGWGWVGGHEQKKNIVGGWGSSGMYGFECAVWS